MEKEHNLFLIDWLTFTAHGCTLDDVKQLIGLTSPDIPWTDINKFRNGYPCSVFWQGITISFGADDPNNYSDPTKVQLNMGICVNMSGSGCRTFESFSQRGWLKLFGMLFTLRDSGVREKNGKLFSYNITRLDIAYDDHIGILDIYRIRQDIEDRNYTSKSKYSEITWSDNQVTDIQGITCQVGSSKSLVLVRIYNKAAERGFKDRHWVRCEIQLRDERASAALSDVVSFGSLSCVASGILRNYLVFRVPSFDSNKSRWPVADYWDKLLGSMVSLSLWVSPGCEYNLSKSEYWLTKQYGPIITVLSQVHDIGYISSKCEELYPVDKLPPKYKSLLDSYELRFGLVSDPTPWG